MFVWKMEPEWLSDMDSNHDKGLQRALCYHYTIGQRAGKIAGPRHERKAKFPFSPASLSKSRRFLQLSRYRQGNYSPITEVNHIHLP